MSLSTTTGQRRLVTVPALGAAALVLVITLPLAIPAAAMFDIVRGRFRCPTARLLAFAVCWTWLEMAGVAASFALWLAGQGRNRTAHYSLQRWWSKNLMRAMSVTCGIRVESAGLDAFDPAPVLLLVRHASLADSLVLADVVTNQLGLRPRFVLKKELLFDPCLDIVGNRLPNHFLDRGANDSAPELAAIEALGHGLGHGEVGIIFPEGTRANPIKRAKALAKITEQDPLRAARLSSLRHLLPPRPSGAEALLRGAPGVDVVVAWHVGFEGLDTFRGILAGLNRGIPPIRFVARRVPRDQIPGDAEFATWLDAQWLRSDCEVDGALETHNERNTP